MRSLVAVAVLAGSVLASPASAAPAETWRSVYLPFLWPYHEVTSVAAAGVDDVWIAGYEGQYCIPVNGWCGPSSPGNPVVRRWTGTWKQYPIKGWTGAGGMAKVDASGTEVWAQGTDTNGTYLGRFSGSTIERVTAPAGTGAVRLVDVGTAGVWVTVGDALHRWNGTGWTPVATPSKVWALSALGASDVLAVGAANAVTRWNGTTWDALPTPPIAEQAYDITALAADDVWLSSQDHLSHGDGSAWTVADPPAGTSIAETVVAADGVPTVRTGPTYPDQVTYRYRAGVWEAATIAPADRYNGLRNFSAVPGSSQIWTYGPSLLGNRLITNG